MAYVNITLDNVTTYKRNKQVSHSLVFFLKVNKYYSNEFTYDREGRFINFFHNKALSLYIK